MIVKLIFNAIMKSIKRRKEWKRLDKYVNEDNELDIKVKSLYKKISKLEKEVKCLKKK